MTTGKKLVTTTDLDSVLTINDSNKVTIAVDNTTITIENGKLKALGTGVLDNYRIIDEIGPNMPEGDYDFITTTNTSGMPNWYAVDFVDSYRKDSRKLATDTPFNPYYYQISDEFNLKRGNELIFMGRKQGDDVYVSADANNVDELGGRQRDGLALTFKRNINEEKWQLIHIQSSMIPRFKGKLDEIANNFMYVTDFSCSLARDDIGIIDYPSKYNETLDSHPAATELADEARIDAVCTQVIGELSCVQTMSFGDKQFRRTGYRNNYPDQFRFNPWYQVNSGNSGSSFDPTALDEKPWKDGTTVLAVQDGKAVRLNTRNIFTDVGIGISANKVTGKVGDTFTVTYTVTNSGTDTNEKCVLTIVKPQVVERNYSISNQNHVGTGLGQVTQDDDVYTITELAQGGTLKVSFDVIMHKAGTLQFGGQVSVTGVDTVKSNNEQTFVITAREDTSSSSGASSNPIPTGKQCELIKAYDVETGKQLKTFACSREAFGKFDSNISATSGLQYNIRDKINLYIEGDTLAGKQIRFENASSIIATSARSQYNYEYLDSLSYNTYSIFSSSSDHHLRCTPAYSRNEKLVFPTVIRYGKELIDESLRAPQSQSQIGTFNADTGIFTFNEDLTANVREALNNTNVLSTVLWVRPEGQNCVWQGCIIMQACKNVVLERTPFAQIPVTVAVEQGQLKETYVDAEDKLASAVKPYDNTEKHGYGMLPYANVVTGKIPDDTVYLAEIKGVSSLRSFFIPYSVERKYAYYMTPGTVATFESSNTKYDLNHINQTGNLNVDHIADNKIRVTVSPNATATDSFYANSFIHFVVVDSLSD